MATDEAGRCTSCAPVAPEARPRRPPVRFSSPASPAAVACGLLVWCVVVHGYAACTGLDWYRTLGGGGVSPLATHLGGEAGGVTEMLEDRAWFRGLATAVTGAAFVLWFRRVRDNAEVLRPDVHRRSRGWAVWAWFVPVANLWLPKQVANDVWRASLPRADRSGPAARRPQAPGPFRYRTLTCWWGAWWAGEALNVLAGGLARGADGGGLRDALLLYAASDALHAADAVLAILVVRRLTAMQLAAFARLAPAPWEARFSA